MRLELVDEEDCCVCMIQKQLAGQAVTTARSSGEVKMRLKLLMRGVVCMCHASSWLGRLCSMCMTRALTRTCT
jgi:hypothetical protein